MQSGAKFSPRTIPIPLLIFPRYPFNRERINWRTNCEKRRTSFPLHYRNNDSVHVEERKGERKNTIGQEREGEREKESRFQVGARPDPGVLYRWCVRVQWSLSGRGDAEPAETAKHTWYVQPSCSPTLRVRSRPTPLAQRERETRGEYRPIHTYIYTHADRRSVYTETDPFLCTVGQAAFEPQAATGYCLD